MSTDGITWTATVVTATTPNTLTFTAPDVVGDYRVRIVFAGGTTSRWIPLLVEPSVLTWLQADRAVVDTGNVAAVPNSATSAIAVDLGVSQVTAAYRPTYQAARASFGGRPAVVHSGSAKYLDSAILAASKSQPITIYTVAEWTAPSVLSYLTDGVDGTSHVVVTSYSGQALISAGVDLNGGTLAAGAATLLCAACSGASSNIYVGNMAVAVKTGSAGTNALRSLRVGASATLTNAFSGAWGTIAVFSGAHDAPTRARIGAHLKTYYGI